MRVCVSVRGRMPTLLHGPGCNLGEWKRIPLVVHYLADLQSVHGLRCHGNIMRNIALCLVVDCEQTAGQIGAVSLASR